MDFGRRKLLEPPSRINIELDSQNLQIVVPESLLEANEDLQLSIPSAVLNASPSSQSAKLGGKSVAKTTSIHKVECWVFDKSHPPSTSFTNGTFTKEEITSWLGEALPGPVDGAKPTGGLRLICREQEFSIEWPFDKATLMAIQETLGLPASYSCRFLPKSGACGRYLGNQGKPVFIYTRSNNNGAISTALQYDSSTNVTTGYALLGPRISLEAACAQICSQFPLFAHPLLVPTVLIELTAGDLMRELYHINRLLTASEDKTGTGDWQIQDTLANLTTSPKPALTIEPSPEPSWYDDVTVEMLKEPSYWAEMTLKMAECKDNHELVRILGWLACRFAFMHAAVNCAISMVEFTRQELESMETYVAPTMRRRFRTKDGKGDATNSSGLVHRVDMLESNLRHMAVFGAIEPRMQAQQSMLFNLINIGIARDSKELTEASKRDSSAMKIIAMLTTFFLPGTFIAAFFAMPILDWQALSMSGVMTNHFWIYWVVAIPLTMLVMAFVVMYGRMQEKRNKKASEEARKEAGFGV